MYVYATGILRLHYTGNNNETVCTLCTVVGLTEWNSNGNMLYVYFRGVFENSI